MEALLLAIVFFLYFAYVSFKNEDDDSEYFGPRETEEYMGCFWILLIIFLLNIFFGIL